MDSFLVLFVAILLTRLDKVLSKIVFGFKFTPANLALKTSPAKLLNSEVVIYLSWLWSLSLFSISVTFVLSSNFLTRPLTSGILFSTIIVAKLLMAGILPYFHDFSIAMSF